MRCNSTLSYSNTSFTSDPIHACRRWCQANSAQCCEWYPNDNLCAIYDGTIIGKYFGYYAVLCPIGTYNDWHIKKYVHNYHDDPSNSHSFI